MVQIADLGGCDLGHVGNKSNDDKARRIATNVARLLAAARQPATLRSKTGHCAPATSTSVIKQIQPKDVIKANHPTEPSPQTGLCSWTCTFGSLGDGHLLQLGGHKRLHDSVRELDRDSRADPDHSNAARGRTAAACGLALP
jgi:hypothetical protein